MKKLLIGLLALASFHSFAGEENDMIFHLGFNEKLVIKCPDVAKLQSKGEGLFCICPRGMKLDSMFGKCTETCSLKIHQVKGYYHYQDNCDQGGCHDETRIYVEGFRVVRLTIGEDIVFQERVYSPRDSEVEMLMSQARSVAKQSGKCSELMGQ